MKKKRAFLKWAGGKYLLVEEIKKYLPEGDCLVEPFVGAGSVFLNTNYNAYIQLTLIMILSIYIIP